MSKLTTLDELIAMQSPQSQERIQKLSDELILETGLAMLREELKLSQKMLANNIGVTQSAIAQIEQRGNELKIATLKRYIESMGGKLSLQIELPHKGVRTFHI